MPLPNQLGAMVGLTQSGTAAALNRMQHAQRSFQRGHCICGGIGAMTLHDTGTHAGAAAGTAPFALNAPGRSSPALPRRSEIVFTTALCRDDLVSGDQARTMSVLPTTMCSGGKAVFGAVRTQLAQAGRILKRGGGSGLCQNTIVANKIVAAKVEPPVRRGAPR